MKVFNGDLAKLIKEFRKSFEPPEDTNTHIWRYMDLSKYLAMLQTRTLFFSNSTELGDPFEGTLTYKTANGLKEDEAKKMIVDGYSMEDIGAYFKYIETGIDFDDSYVCAFVNCWHMNERESAAMWRLYAKSDEAIAIQSTYHRLRECLPKRVHIGKVEYIDYDAEEVNPDNPTLNYKYKRASFSHEREIRAISFQEINHWDFVETDPYPSASAAYPYSLSINLPPGKPIHISLNTLIEKVYVSPTAPNWFYEVVAKVSAKYRIKAPVQSSSLAARPILW